MGSALSALLVGVAGSTTCQPRVDLAPNAAAKAPAIAYQAPGTVAAAHHFLTHLHNRTRALLLLDGDRGRARIDRSRAARVELNLRLSAAGEHKRDHAK